jgi:hypothetical protein
LRKYLTAAVAAVAAFSVTAVAIAQNPAPTPTAEVTVSPKRAGKKNKPKPVALGIFVENTKESKTTASDIQIDFPSTLRVSGKGLKKCSLTVLGQGGPDACPAKSKVGSGVAHAVLGPHGSAVPLTLDVTALVGGPKNVFFYVKVQGVDVAGVLNAKVTKKGSRLTMSIPESLKKPDGVTYSALTDLDVDIKRASKVVKSYGCKGGKYTTKIKLTYEANPVPPAVPSATATDTTACKK